MSTYKFTENHPPLLANLGFGGIANTQESKGPEEHYEMQFVIRTYGPNSWPFTLPATVTRQKVWVRLGSPERLSGKETVSVTETLAQSYTELNTLRALLSATVGGSYGPFSAEVKGEIETTKTKTASWSSERSHTKTVEREGHRMYADWSLIDRINIAYDLSAYDDMPGIGGVDPKALKKALNEALKDKRYFETYLALFQDDMIDEESILNNAFAGLSALPALNLMQVA